jgi:hypothetical protein
MTPAAADPRNALVAKVSYVLKQPDAVIFVGSGLSRWSNLPSWPGLLVELADFLDGEGLSSELVRRELELNELLQAASYGIDLLTPPQFAQFIRKACRVGTAQPHEIHRKLVQLPPTAYITTNYDPLIEESLKRWRSDEFFRTVTNNHVTETAEIVKATACHFVFKPHGDAADASSVILTREQYRTLYGEKVRVLDALKTLLVSRPVLFIGFGLRDVDFLYVKDVLANIYDGSARDHYAIMSNVTDQEQSYWRRKFGIHLLSYPAPPRSDGKGQDHSALLTLLDDLATVSTPKLLPTTTGSASCVPADESGTILALARYAAGVIRMRPLLGDLVLPLQVTFNRFDENDSMAKIEFMYHTSSVEKFLDTFPSNALLLGNPGAGKTCSFLSYCADAGRKLQDACLTKSEEFDQAIVPIYLDLKVYSGRLWDMAQNMLPPTLSLESLCSTGRVRFFVDAANETPREYLERGTFETDLDEFLRKTSSCRVIFGSRTDEGLQKLGMSKFRIEEIAPQFIEDYLARKGVQLKGNLKEEVIALLQKPLFFRMYHDARISLGEMAHPHQLYESFFDRLSDEFAAKFGSRVSLVDLLSSLAYQAVDRGQEAFPLAEITNRLRQGLQASGVENLDAAKVINWLIFKNLLVPASGVRLAFYHQSVTEFLAANELAVLYRTKPDILEERLRNTRWDQALFLTLAFLGEEQARPFMKRVLATDTILAIRAAKYVEFDRNRVVDQILDTMLEWKSTDFEDEFTVSWNLAALPVSPDHRPQLQRLVSRGNVIGAAAGHLLLKAAGREVAPTLLAEISSRADDYNFCNRLAESVKDFLTDEDVSSTALRSADKG